MTSMRNTRKDQIVELLEARGVGLTATEISIELKMPSSNVWIILQQLLEEGVLVRRITQLLRHQKYVFRHWLRSCGPPPIKPEELTRIVRILYFLQATPNASSVELASSLDISYQAVHYHLADLQILGLITVLPKERPLRYYWRPQWYQDNNEPQHHIPQGRNKKYISSVPLRLLRPGPMSIRQLENRWSPGKTSIVLGCIHTLECTGLVYSDWIERLSVVGYVLADVLQPP
jgi:biotin operon repressor